MNYSQDEFLQLTILIESQGGRLLDEDCTPQSFRLKRTPEGPERLVYGQGCDNPSLFEVTYPIEDGAATVNMGTLRACAVCDNMGMWPRFQQTGDSE